MILLEHGVPFFASIEKEESEFFAFAPLQLTLHRGSDTARTTSSISATI